MDTHQVAGSRQRRWAALSVVVVAFAVAAAACAPKLQPDTSPSVRTVATAAPQAAGVSSATPMSSTGSDGSAAAAAAKPASKGSSPIAPGDKPYGNTYGTWGGLWWTWAVSIPPDKNPVHDPTGENCAANQSGDVWNLAITFDADEQSKGQFVGKAERSCTIPAGKAILVPVMIARCSTAEGNGTTYEELSACAKERMDTAAVVRAEWDGAPIAGDPTSPSFRAQSPLMKFTLPGPTQGDNILNLPPGPSDFVSDGYFLMLPPPGPGKHTLRIYGVSKFQGDQGEDMSFTQDVTYHLNIGG